MMKRRLVQTRRQRGAALFVALMMLLLLTLGALAAMSSSILQERMVGATFQAMRAAQRAQERLADGEQRAYEFVTGLNLEIFFVDCEELTGGQSCSSAGGFRAVTGLPDFLRSQLGTTEVTLMCGDGDLIALNTPPPPRTLGQAIEERTFQLTASAAVCNGNSPIGALPVVVQSYYSP